MKAVRESSALFLAAVTLGLAAPPATATVTTASTPEAPPTNGHVVIATSTETSLDTGQEVVTTTTTTLDRRGNTVGSLVTISTNGHLDSSVETSNTFGSGNRLEESVRVTDSDGEGSRAPDTEKVVLSYDKRGQLVSELTTTDLGTDGVIDRTRTSSLTRDAQGRVITSVMEDEFGTSTTTTTFDSRGRVVSTSTDIDLASTPQALDLRQVSTTGYDNAGNPTTYTAASYTVDGQGSATLDDLSITTLTLNSRGDVVRAVSEVDYDGDGNVDATHTTATTYDPRGRAIGSTSTSTSWGGPTVESVTHDVYDKRGDLVSSVSESSIDGVMQHRVSSVWTHDSRHRVVMQVQRIEDGAGNVEQTWTSTYDYDNKDRVVASTDQAADETGKVTFSRVSTSAYTNETVTTTTEYDDDGDGVVDRTRVDVSPL